MENNDWNELIKNIDNSHSFLQKRENGLLLSDEEIEVLKRYDIDYLNYSNISSLLFEIEEYLNNNPDAEDLENVSGRLAEFQYYYETEK